MSKAIFVAGAVVLFAAALFFIFTGPYRPVAAVAPGIIDIHCHVAGIGAGGSGCFVSKELRANWRFGIYLRSFGVSEKELSEKGDMLLADRISELAAKSRYVEKVVLLALDGAVDAGGALDAARTQLCVPDEFVAAAAARHPNLLFGASVNPYRKDALERLVWAKKNGAVLVKWIPSIMAIDPADKKLVPFYRKLVELRLPLLTHAGQERAFPGTRDEFCDPDKLSLPLSLGVTVIAAHAAAGGSYAGERSTDRLARLMLKYPNLYADISSLTQLNKYGGLKEALTRPEFSGRLLYGSDFPYLNTGLVSPWYYGPALGPRRLLSVIRTANIWDRDVLLKQQLGTPAEVFARSRQVILKAARSGSGRDLMLRQRIKDELTRPAGFTHGPGGPGNGGPGMTASGDFK
ncbi:MAG: amidohydrolase family protein [Elusimicrobia bacterium]|nr:amidohydrolase family protein [Elusimicrobiota bacterium]